MEEKNESREVKPFNPTQNVIPLNTIKQNINLIHSLMKEVMQENQHYGLIPGCGSKPSLLKAGAEKLCFMFRLRPVINLAADVQFNPMPNGHMEYRVICHILNVDGLELATGLGSCSTLETKYRWRFGKQSNPADFYNTCFKMAKKRAHVDGTIAAIAASDMFTQDGEDMDILQTKQSEDTVTTKPVQPSSEIDVLAKELFENSEKFKLWRIENSLAETLKTATAEERAAVLQALKELKAKKNKAEEEQYEPGN